MTNVEKRAFPLIDAHYIEQIRRPQPGRRNPIEYGALERVTGTGRARCRCCGKKIAKGERELRFYWDFNGCGSWTAVECHVHEKDCR